MFSTLYGTCFSFYMHFKMSSAICFSLDQSKIVSSDNGLRCTRYSFQPSAPYGVRIISPETLEFLFLS